MIRTIKKKIDLLLSLLSVVLLSINVGGQDLSLQLHWKFNTGDKVLASPIIHNDTIFIGSQNGIFYALHLKSGEEIWKYETGGIIQTKALIIDEIVFFESANIFYALNYKSGKEVWKFNPMIKPKGFKYNGVAYHYLIDPFDFKRSSPIAHKGIIYIGASNGTVYGFNSKSGKVVFEIKSDDTSPIRSTPFVEGGTLYFGDWEGVVYCYDLVKNTMLWKKKTYRGEKPYGTFGGVVSEFLVYKDLLFFGARNQMKNVLLKETGEKEWTFTDSKGGWMWGDPVIWKDTLYVGGSDNFKLFAFNPHIGQIYWTQTRNKNICGKPYVTDQWIAYTGGNGYDTDDSGELVLVRRKDGKVLDVFGTPKAVFSAPTASANNLVFTCYDGNVYCLSIIGRD